MRDWEVRRRMGEEGEEVDPDGRGGEVQGALGEFGGGGGGGDGGRLMDLDRSLLGGRNLGDGWEARRKRW